MYVHNKKVAIVLLDQLGLKLDLKMLLKDDYTSFYAFVVCNQELHTLNHNNKNYH